MFYRHRPSRPRSRAVCALRTDWRALRDTHDFNAMLHRHKVGRLQAIRLIGRGFVGQVSASRVPDILHAAAARAVSIMVFVGNRGAIQIHSGPVRNLKWAGPWFNVLDPDFNLHLRADRVASAWVVRKPTDDGIVTSLELFSPEDEVIAYMFGARKPGIRSWRPGAPWCATKRCPSARREAFQAALVGTSAVSQCDRSFERIVTAR